MGGQYASCKDRFMFTASIFAVFVTVIQALPTTKSFRSAPSSSQPPTTLSFKDQLDKWMNMKVLPDYGVFNEVTYEPYGESWVLPEWQPNTMAPWSDTGGAFGDPQNPYDTGPNVDMGGSVISTLKPVHFDFSDSNAHHVWEDNSSMGSYTWITMAVVLVVFFKVTVIAVMIARRMRYRQHRVVIRRANTNSVTVPSEFTSDQAHLVTPANIVYVDTEGTAPPPLPQMFTPPPYCESLLPNSEAAPVTPNEEPPPYSS